MPFLVAVQTQWERPAAPAAESEESKPHILYRGAFVLLTDDSKCRLARIENISILEAYQCDLLRSMPKGVESLSNRPCCALPPLLFSCLDAFQAQEQPLRSCKLPRSSAQRAIVDPKAE